MIISNGCFTPKEWTVNTNSRHDYTLVADAIITDWINSQSK